MRIHIYGCSWSAGTPEIDNFNSWAKELAKLEPNWHIYNFSLGGSSSHFATYNYIWSKQNIKEPVYHIFQGTSQYRWTHITQDIIPINYLKQLEKNYWSFVPHNSIRKITQTYQIKSQDKLPRRLSIHYQNKIRYEHESQWEFERMSHFESLRNNINLCFFHRQQDKEEYKKFFNHDVICVQEILGNDVFFKYTEDYGMHFGTFGLKWQAKYIRNTIKKELNYNV